MENKYIFNWVIQEKKTLKTKSLNHHQFGKRFREITWGKKMILYLGMCFIFVILYFVPWDSSPLIPPFGDNLFSIFSRHLRQILPVSLGVSGFTSRIRKMMIGSNVLVLHVPERPSSERVMFDEFVGKCWIFDVFFILFFFSNDVHGVVFIVYGFIW